MHPVGFDAVIPASVQLQTHAQDRVTAGIG